jgi:two-component system sensor histidine kinase CpxA
MRSLFLKIFLWFWLAMILVNVASFLSFIATHKEHEREMRSESFAPALEIYAQTAVEIYEKNGASVLNDYLTRLERPAHLRAFLFDSKGVQISNHLAPPGAREAAINALQNGGRLFESTRHPPLVAQVAASPRGERYTLVGEMLPLPPPGNFPNEIRAQALRLFIILIIGGAFCYWLARHLTTPIVQLRATTQSLADGNFKARVGASLTARRDEVALLGQDFNLMAERIESLLIAQRLLLGDISHELRSPLTRLGIALELARQRAGREAQSALDRIARESETLNEMIERVLTIARFESGMEETPRENVYLLSLVQKIVADTDFEANNRNRAVKLLASDDCVINGSTELLQSAIENVIRNAVRYTAERTTVEVSLRCRYEGEKEFALITVRDHGAGVPTEALEKIFQPFYRVEDGRDRQSGDTGLGLAIAARAVRLHGGEISARNAPDSGLIVEIKLPALAKYQFD